MTIAKAAQIAESGDRYLIDETTAIVRFIFPCGDPVARQPGSSDSLADLDEPAPNSSDTSSEGEANKIRWFFNALFVQSIIQVVNGEAEIWMVESGLRNRLHIWKVIVWDFRFTLPISTLLVDRAASLGKVLAGFGPGCFQRRREGAVSRPVGPQRPEMSFFHSIPQTRFPLPPYLVTEICCALQAAYPVGDGSVAILRSMPPNNRRVRCPSANSNQ